MKGVLLRILSFVCSVIFLLSCQEEDNIFYEYIEKNGEELESRIWQNQWIYRNMRYNYFWTDEMKDSADCDFSSDPGTFFEYLLVDEDRFSYMEINENYVPKTRTANLNETISFDSIYSVNGVKIGYFVYDGFDTEADLTDLALIFNKSGVEELIVDLRYNPGGLINTCIYLASLIVPSEHLGKVFCSYRYNKYISAENIELYDSPITYSYFRNDPIVKQRSFNVDRVFFLVSKHSASCSELLINSLRPYMNVITIGETTTGKDVGMRTISAQHSKYVLHPITFRTYNALGDSVPSTGLIPDISIIDVNNGEIGNADEALLSAALNYIKHTEDDSNMES